MDVSSTSLTPTISTSSTYSNSNINTTTTLTSSSSSSSSSPSSTELISYQTQFQNIYECIKLLIHSTKISVGLITQALNTKGLSQHMCIFDFIQSIQSACDNYCRLYSVFNILNVEYQYLLNNTKIKINEFNGLYVVGEITAIQTILDSILSNAVR